MELATRECLIEPAQPGDARAIAALRTAVAEQMTREFGPGHWSGVTSRADVQRQMKASQILVARQDDHIVGTVRVTSVNPRAMASAGFTPVGSALYVLGLAVSPDYRKMGVGRQLMEAAKDQARIRRAEALWLDAYDGLVGAGPFYLRCGFRRVGSAGERRVPLVYYEWLVK
jgi:predicted N-acetyltransferase YhbS